MLRPGGPFLENGADEVRFPDDNPYAFEIILRIIYHQNNTLPAKLGLDTLLDLAVLIDKYDLHTVVRPFIPTWAAEISKTTMARYAPHERILFVAWTFGLQEVFDHMLLKLVLNCKLDNNDDLIWLNRKVNLDLLPIGVPGL
jgi:hypothetical protein